MSDANTSLLLRFARWQARALVRVWPGESRRWGEAMASEAQEIERPWEALWWTLGGATVYLRALGTHVLSWLKLPVGERGTGGMAPLTNAPGPKRSRLFTAAVLAGAVGLLCIPEGREGVRTLRAIWENYAEIEPDQKALEKIAVRAEKENDARTMAFAALSLQDEKRRITLADRAVTLDPRLFWIYEVQRFGLGYQTAKPEIAAKAEAADPDNAVPYLLAAESIAERHYFALVSQHSPTEKEVDDALAGDAEWMALMDRAFHAGRYDSHYREHEELNREVWIREPQLSFAPVLIGLAAHSIPNMLSLKRFTKLLVRKSEEERAEGHLDKAAELLTEADGFGERMQQDPTDIERLVGTALQREAALAWKSFYEKTGRAAEAQAAAQSLVQIDQHNRESLAKRQERFRSLPRRERDGWIVQISAILMLLAGIVAILSVGLLELRPTVWKRKQLARRVLCWTADIAPAGVLAMCVVFLLSFLPFEHFLAAFRSGNPADPHGQQARVALWSLLNVPYRIGGAGAAVLGWTALTVVLSVLLGLILARMVYRTRRRAAPQT